jgi:hypothetical protein
VIGLTAPPAKTELDLRNCCTYRLNPGLIRQSFLRRIWENYWCMFKLRNPSRVETHLLLSSFPSMMLACLLLPISGFVLNILWLVTDTLHHFEFLLASHFLCLPQEVNTLQALLAGVGANSDCDWLIDDRELLGLCFPFLCQNSAQALCGQVCLPHRRHQAFVKLACARNRATTTMGINILTENHEWVCFVNYSDPDSKCQ